MNIKLKGAERSYVVFGCMAEVGPRAVVVVIVALRIAIFMVVVVVAPWRARDSPRDPSATRFATRPWPAPRPPRGPSREEEYRDGEGVSFHCFPSSL